MDDSHTDRGQAFTPVAILLLSAAFKIQSLNQKLVAIILVS
jgi:hypothetical protein